MTDPGPEGDGRVPERVPPPGIDGDLDSAHVDYDDLEPMEVVGRGGNATVSTARVRGDPDRVVALKEPHRVEGVPTEVADRFRVEAETWAAVDDHPGVLAVYGWGTDPHPWIATEYADGGSLADRIGGDPDRGLWVGARVAAALDHAHREGVVHLDLKPENVLFRGTPGDAWAVPAVADWGMAGSLGSGTVNLEGLSPRYAAPEQFAPGEYGPVGPATDVYGLGVVLYESLVGTVPFDGPPRTLRDAVLEERPPPASGRNPDLSPAVDDVLDRALAKTPADRHDSADAFRRELADLFAERTGDDPDGAAAGTLDRDPGIAPPESPSGAEPRPPVQEPPSPAYDRALDLADEGFVQLSEAFFARRDPADPLAAWRRGVTLADARAGRAVERTVEVDGSRRGLTDLLIDGLAAGTDHVVLGPPGSGKSTVCRRVACEWFDLGHGTVLYRESGQGDRFERPDALASRLGTAGDHALVVVEDAVRPGASAAFEFLDRVRDVEGVTVLADARESEWRDAGGDPGPFGDDPVTRAREALEPVYVPRPDERGRERFVRAVEDATDRPIDVDREALRADVRRAAAGDPDAGESRPGELFYLLHRLTALAGDPLEAGETPTTLTDAVADTYGRLADLGEAALDVGVCANVCNAAGIGVHPELLYAVVPGDPLAVDDAVEVLDGRVLFPREADWSGGTRAYPAVHEAWSTAFLAHLVEAEGEDAAGERFGRVVSRVLSLADDDERRGRVEAALRGDAPYLARIERDPETWAGETVEAVHELGRERPKLARLFGDGRADTVELPGACRKAVVERRPAWLGWMFLEGGYFDRAERAFERLPGDGADAAVERLLGLARVGIDRGDYDDALAWAEECLALVEDRDRIDGADRSVVGARADLAIGRARSRLGDYDAAVEHGQRAREAFAAAGNGEYLARCLDLLGNVAQFRGEYGTAREYHGRSLEVRRAIGDRPGEARSLSNLGEVADSEAEYGTAREYHQRSLALRRDIGDRKGEAASLNNLGVIGLRLGNHDEVREYCRESLAIFREIGYSRGAGASLNNLGEAAKLEGEYDTAARYFEESLAIFRELGERWGEAENLDGLAEVARYRGAYDAARDRLATIVEHYRELGAVREELAAIEDRAAVAVETGNPAAAAEWCDRGLERIRESSVGGLDRQREDLEALHPETWPRERTGSVGSRDSG